MNSSFFRTLVITLACAGMPFLVLGHLFIDYNKSNQFFPLVQLEFDPHLWQVPGQVFSSAVSTWRMQGVSVVEEVPPKKKMASASGRRTNHPHYASVKKNYQKLLEVPSSSNPSVAENSPVDEDWQYLEVVLEVDPQLNNQELVKLPAFATGHSVVTGELLAHLQDFAIEKMVAANLPSDSTPGLAEKNTNTEDTLQAIDSEASPLATPVEATIGQDQQQDEVATQLAAGEEKGPVFYEYSSGGSETIQENVMPQSVAVAKNIGKEDARRMIYEGDQGQVSNTVAAAISRNQEVIGQVDRQEKAVAASPLPTQYLLDTQKGLMAPERSGKKVISLRPMLIESSDKINGYPSRMEFIPSYDPMEVVNDDGQGKIEILHNYLSGSLLRGVIQGRQFLPTRIEVPISRLAQIDQEVPLLTAEFLQNQLEKSHISHHTGGILLLEFEQVPIEFDINSNYQLALYFNQDFAPVGDLASSKYLLLVGPESGNRVINLHYQAGSASKIVHLKEDEIFFDYILPYEDQQIFQLAERNVLSSESAPLDVSSRDISYYDGTRNVSKKGVGNYQVFNPITLAGMKHYFQLKHSRFPIYVGLNRDDRLEIPSDLFVASIFDIFEIEKLDQRCLVQINLGESPLEVMINGEGADPGPFLELKFLDRDGETGDEVSESTAYALVLGEKEGVFSMRIKYSNDTEFLLQSFCGQDTYLVEQL